jgi:hypothetical protein
MPKKIVRVKKVGAIKQPVFKLSLDIGDDNYKAKGQTILECLDNIEPDKFRLRTFGIFNLKAGNKKSQLRQTPFQIRRMKINHTAKVLMADRLDSMLK